MRGGLTAISCSNTTCTTWTSCCYIPCCRPTFVVLVGLLLCSLTGEVVSFKESLLDTKSMRQLCGCRPAMARSTAMIFNRPWFSTQHNSIGTPRKRTHLHSHLGCSSSRTNHPSRSTILRGGSYINNNRRNTQSVFFGSRADVSGNPPGTIEIYNEQQDIPNIDEDALRDTIRRISQLIGYETYDVTLLLVDDDEMRETNLESRDIDAPTDILSFPFLPPTGTHEPGVLAKPQFDIPEYYNLGDMVVDVPYVMRRCQEDKEDYIILKEGEEEASTAAEYDSDSCDDEEEERGVSGAMATVYDPEKRIHMLMVHGMLHLVHYDHEDDEEYELMVTREEEILKELGLLPLDKIVKS